MTLPYDTNNFWTNIIMMLCRMELILCVSNAKDIFLPAGATHYEISV
jgi:hypothetical protein